MYPRNRVCFRYIIVNILHIGDIIVIRVVVVIIIIIIVIINSKNYKVQGLCQPNIVRNQYRISLICQKVVGMFRIIDAKVLTD